MASTLYFAPTANFKQTTLNGAINSSVQTITLNSTANLQAPGSIVIDRVNTAGTSTPNSREVVTFTGINGNDLTGCARGADNSSALAHSDGAIVETTLTVGVYNSLATIVGAAIDGSGYLRAISSPVSIARAELTQMALSSVASIANLQVGSLVLSSAVIPSVASIGRVQSDVYGGAKGHFLWLQSGALTTSLATSTNNSQMNFLRATKNLTLINVYAGLNSAPSLGPLQFDIYYKSTPTGVTGTSIFSVRPLVGIGLNENTAGATIGTINLVSLASGTLLYPEIRQPNGAGDLTIQLTATERT